ncbi:MAG TPA: methionyl-tRNA formyltransferase [Solirubrobacteraceae bacterium]|nr:methionyl-tRNA formyltransferase [Solirubrobacteraceae bacterium]
MRTVYLGTSPFAAAVLRALAATPHRPRLVITRPDRPRGRGRRLAAPPVADAARELDLELAQPPSVNEPPARERIAAASPDVLVVCAFGALIKEPLLSDHEVLNVHPSLLPRWRGAAPIERAIMAGDARTGVSIMRLTAGLDTGPVALRGEEPIEPGDTYGTLSERLQELGARLLIEALDAGPDGLRFEEQPDEGATYAEKITAGDRLLHPSAEPAGVLERRIRALNPHIGAALTLPDGARLGVWDARARPGGPGDPAAGELDLTRTPPVLGCAGPSALELGEVQPAGGRRMDAAAWARGHAPR